MLYLADKKAKLFKGDYKPVSLYLGNGKAAGYEYTEQTGEYLTFENTYNDTASVVINGKSEQVQTVQGKNLLDMEFVVGYFNDDILIPGEPYRSFDRDVLLPAGTYTFSRPGGDFYIVRIRLNGITTNISGSGWFRTFTISEPTYVNFSWRNGTNTDWLYGENSADAELQLELGPIATEYEPFVPNSPSPEYPSPIKSVGDDGGFDLVSAGKNLFDMESALAYFPNIEYDSDIGITLSKSDPASWENKPVFITLPAGTYYFSTTGNKARLQIQDENSRAIATNVITPTSISLNGTTGLKIKILTETSIYPWVIGNFQISATATPYTPFRGMQTVHIPYTLRSLPDGTCDYIEIDNVTKTAKLYRNIGEKVFNGTETFSSDYQGTEYFRVYSVLSTMTNVTLSSAICSHFPYGGYYQITNENFSTTPFTSPVVAFIVKRSTVGATTGNTTAELITLFKSWLADQYNNGTPVTAQYKLATPTVTDLDYEEIKSYYPYTQIYTTATVQPTLEGKIRVWTA